MLTSLTQISLCDCARCGLAGVPIVPGRGPSDAEILIVGEAPGEDEEAQEKPFVGRTGQATRRLLKLLGVDPEQCYWTNTVLCRPALNRDPNRGEVSACNRRLHAEIEAVNPKKIILLGSHAARAYWGCTTKVSDVQGRVLYDKGRELMATKHPATMLREPRVYPVILSHLHRLLAGPTENAKLLDWDTPYLKIEHLEHVEEALHELLTEADAGAPLILDIETVPKASYVWADPDFSSRRPEEGKIWMVGLKAGKVFRLFWTGAEHMGQPALKLIGRALHKRYVVAHEFLYEYAWIRYHCRALLRPLDDPRILSYLETPEPSAFDYHNLKTNGMERFDIGDWSAPLNKVVGNLRKASVDVVYDYLAIDLIVTEGLFHQLSPYVDRSPATKVIYPTMPYLAAIQRNGMAFDTRRCRAVRKRLETAAATKAKRVCEATGGQVTNANSNPQLGRYLFETLRLPHPDTARHRHHKPRNSTRAEVLSELYAEHPDIPMLQELAAYRKITKLLTSYIRPYLKAIDRDGRLRGRFDYTATDTGRLACSKINLQNVPARGKYGRLIMSCFKAPPGKALLGFDLAQIEFRVAAYRSNDLAMIDYINSGRDVHTEFAAHLYSVPIEQVTKDMRTNAKTFNFGYMYDRSLPAIMAAFQIDQERGEWVTKLFDETFPGFIAYKKQVQDMAVEQHYTRSAFGRVKYYPIIIDKKHESEVRRMAINHDIQATASDINLIGGDRAWRACKGLYLPVNTIHDANLGEVDDDRLEEVIRICTGAMEEPVFPDQPLTFTVEAKVGRVWSDMMSIEAYRERYATPS